MINNDLHNNNLQHISKGLDEILTDMLVRCMLNPNNKDFYIKNLTLDKVASYFAEMPQNDASVATVFWSAYSRAEAQYRKDIEQEQYLNELHNEEHFEGCPECGCPEHLGYIKGVRCPNCDYVEN